MENIEMVDRIKQLRIVLYSRLVYIKQILLCALLVAVAVGISFLFTGGFTSQAYSDRLFLTSIIVTSIGVCVFVTIAGTRKNMGLPTIVKTEEDARKLKEQTHELINIAEKRYDLGSQVWAIGIACLFLSILVYFLLSVINI